MAVCSLCASAQYYAGGALGFWHKDEKGVATNSLTILPELGMTLNDNWGIGATIGYTYNHLCGISVSSHLFEFNPYARYTYWRRTRHRPQPDKTLQPRGPRRLPGIQRSKQRSQSRRPRRRRRPPAQQQQHLLRLLRKLLKTPTPQKHGSTRTMLFCALWRFISTRTVDGL